MPGPGAWFVASNDPDFYSSLKFEEGSLKEICLHDDDRKDQGKAVLQICKVYSGNGNKGQFVKGKLKLIEDEYYEWWYDFST